LRRAWGGIPSPRGPPLGVAYRRRPCFEDAAQLRRRCERSHRRLRATVLGLATGLVAMVFLAGAFALRHQTAPVRLETEVGHFRASEQAQPVGLRYRHVARKIEELAALQADPDFERLPQEQQDYVRDRLEELRAFEEFERRVNELTDPRDVAQEGQLHQLHEAVEQLAAFPGRRPEWDETEAGRRWQLWRTDTAALLAAVRQTREGYQRVLEEGVRVLLRKDEANLPSRARAVLDRCRQLPHPVQDRDRLIPGSRRLTYAGVFRFPTVAETVRRWDEEVRKKLELAAQLAS
ncbi:MAG: hypothetical protein NZ700_13730, partial [Gemmataceae bacterium]|nr:hypothetical protein [Gemmataceae bacterium]MDW8266764.1 hypothetical protein [Gemmataceae bacterium]